MSGDGVRPRLSFGSWAFAFGPFARDPWSIARICDYVANAGYDGIELNGFRPHPHDRDFNSEGTCRVLRDLVAGYGLSVSAYAPEAAWVVRRLLRLELHECDQGGWSYARPGQAASPPLAAPVPT
jgi:sugar phosphate isomerase/epimerase